MNRDTAVGLGGSLATAVLCWLDYLTGPEVGFSLFYLVPIGIAAWYTRRGTALFVACVAAACWLFAEVALTPVPTSLGVSAWNGFTRFVIYVGAAILLGTLRHDRDRFRALAAAEGALARTDTTTGLLNVRGLLETMDRQIELAGAGDAPMAVIYLDLDNFKKFNDSLGHAAGDVVLTEVGTILRKSAAPDGWASRVGGDEFAVLLVNRDSASAGAWASEAVARIREIGCLYPGIGFGATAGVAVFTSLPESGEAMLRTADDAMYRGKSRSRGSVTIEQV